MVVSIGVALLKTLSSFLFEQYLYTTVEYDIDNAPSWFYQETASEMCSFKYEYGGLESIEKAKAAAHKEMEKKIDKLVDVSIYQNYKNTTTPNETRMLKAFAKDANLGLFVDSNLQYTKVKHEDNANITFVKACIPKETILTYQTERFAGIQKELSVYRSDEALDSLDKEFDDNPQDDKLYE